MSSFDHNAFTDKVTLVLVDGETGKVKKRLIQTQYGCIDAELEKKINKELTNIFLERLMRERRRLMEAVMWGV